MEYNNYDVEKLKDSLNIVDVIERYIPLKKQGDNYFACCPFHGEKTASFSVSESKQFYHCFGCPSNGDVINFVMEYEGVEFIEAVKILGGELDSMNPNDIIRNIKHNKARPRYRVPPCHKENREVAHATMEVCKSGHDVMPVYLHSRGHCYPVVTACGELVNIADFSNGQPFRFAAGGLSYNGFTNIRVHDGNDYFACVSITTARRLAFDFKLNVALCWDNNVMKYICEFNNAELNITPVIEKHDDDYLCYEREWVLAEQNNRELKLTKMGVLV